MKAEEKYIEKLVERFLEGETSNEEEKELYSFFRTGEIPDELIPYKAFFAYFETGIAAELGVEKKKKSRYSLTRSRLLFYSSLAASFLILAGVSLFFSQQEDSFNPYEGSYIVRGGVRITDPDKIGPELEKTVLQAIQKQKEAEALVCRAGQPEAKNQLTQEYLREHRMKLLYRFPDDRVREEVRKILDL